MHKQLIIEVFKKAEKELMEEDGRKPAKLPTAIHIETYLNKKKIDINEKSLRNYYDGARGKDVDEDIIIPQTKVVKGLCEYLGFDSYKEFEASLKVSVQPNKHHKLRYRFRKLSSVKKFWVSIMLILSIGFLGVLIGSFVFADEVRWMIWMEDHYEEVDFDQEKLTDGTLKLYKQDRIDHFRKVKNPDCDYPYFNDDGSVNAWYAKTSEGKIEVFTDIGLHPLTGKALKDISEHIIGKYLCPN